MFVPNSLIDETIKFKVIKVKKNFAIGKLIEVKEQSSERVEPPCVYYMRGLSITTYDIPSSIEYEERTSG